MHRFWMAHAVGLICLCFGLGLDNMDSEEAVIVSDFKSKSDGLSKITTTPSAGAVGACKHCFAFVGNGALPSGTQFFPRRLFSKIPPVSLPAEP
jgi:hypothetical protein